MLSLLPTVSVEIGIPVKDTSEKDSFGDIQLNWIYEVQDGCIVVPYSSIERTGPFDLLDETKISVYIPTAFTKSLRNAKLIYRGTTYRVLGNPPPFVGVALPWDRQVIAEEVLFDE
jgi:hypothetical protein